MEKALLWRVAFAASAGTAGGFAAAIEPFCHSVAWFEYKEHPDGSLWRVEGLGAHEPNRARLTAATAAAAVAFGVAAPNLDIDILPARDWSGDSLRAFPPIRIGRYFIYGSHVKEPVPAGVVALRIDAGMAFGSGEHASTAGCLSVLDRLARRRRFRNALDLGCGSGILALAAAKTWRAPVLAVDIDPEAVAVTRANAKTNKVAPLVRAAASDGYNSPAVRAARPFDLIVANVLARPLARMAGSLARHLAPGGIAVLSGVIDADGPWLVAAHRPFGLRLVRRESRDGWTALVLRRPR
jgi:ribosomal protein L11 methyltransferase